MEKDWVTGTVTAGARYMGHIVINEQWLIASLLFGITVNFYGIF